MLKLHLPYPPSLNSLYPGKVRRHKSEEYKEWIKEASRMLDRQYRRLHDYPVQVVYKFGKPDNRNRDLANLEKAISDLLVADSVLKDDSLIQRMTLEWADIEGCDILIEAFVA